MSFINAYWFGGASSTLLDGLVSWWSLDETSGTRYDAHGSNDLTDTNTVGYAAGKVGNAASFVSANSEYLESANNSDMEGGARDWSFICWAQHTGAATEVIAGHGRSGQGVASDSGWRVDYTSSSSEYRALIAAGSSFKSVFATSHGTPSGGIDCIYIQYVAATNTLGIKINNGTLDTVNTGAHSNTSADFDFVISGRIAGTSAYWNGLVDEPAFYSQIMSTDQQNEYWNSGNGTGYPG